MEKKTWSVLLNAMLIPVVRVVAFLVVERCDGGLRGLSGLAIRAYSIMMSPFQSALAITTSIRYGKLGTTLW
jgi:hypothetical protein